ncbi:MAG: methionine--tRNA ligase [Ruminococcaceae bacterium]|nr:methionine--tRNA ligase [Oscillospiraceae bacterium]
MQQKTPFYITTAIAYASRKPHIGNCYDIVLADMIARYKRMTGYDVFFMTGSDEHGQKIEDIAKEQGISPQEYVDGVAALIKEQWDCLNTTYDKFIRTTDADHESVVQKIFKKLYEQGDIYKSEYEGKYCIPCESFFTSSQLVDGKCPDCGREVTDAKEEAYFLRLSKYQDQLAAYYEENPDFFRPLSRKAEMVNNFLKPGLSDLCVSRSSFKWGVPVEFDDRHVIYVWIDALSNYITGLGYDPDGSSERFEKFWPANLHVIGKDIVRFHTIYWPIILMALGLPLPKQVLGHPWLLSGEDKMSKSRGNVLYADALVKRFGTDAVRYYLLSEMPYGNDGTITYESFITKFNADLANTLGNLVNRSIAMTNKYFGGTVHAPAEITEELDKELYQVAADTLASYTALMEDYRNADAAEAIMTLAKRCNKYIDETAPWVLAKSEEDKPRLETVLYNLLECIRMLGVMLTPFIPSACASIAAQLQIHEDAATLESLSTRTASFSVGEASPLFQRIDAAKMLAEIEAEQAAAIAAAEAEEKAAQNVAFLPEIAYDEFTKVDLRVAKITACEPIKKAKKLLKLTLDDGSGTPRTVASGIAKYYTPDELIGRSVILVANLKPAVLCGVESCGMILAADALKEDGSEDVRVLFVDGLKPGSTIR